VLKEFALLQRLGGRRVFICDDDFIGDYKYAQALLQEIIGLNRSFDVPLSFTTQCTIDLAKHDGILRLMADANFNSVFVGIETPRKASLKEVNKVQNLQRDLVEDVRKIQSYGLVLKTGLIVGFDSDDTGVFKEHVEFAEKACLTEITVRTLKGMRGTPQWNLFQREGRILDTKDIALESPRAITNVVPKGMTMREMMDGYVWLTGEIRDWNSFRKRVIGALKMIEYVPEHIDPARLRMPPRKKNASWRKLLPWKARFAILHILLYTKLRRPYMMQRVAGIIAEQLLDRALADYQRSVVDRFVHMYESGQLQRDADESVGLIPNDFERAVTKVMPVIYDRLVVELQYKPAIPEIYVSIFQDFLIRWGNNFRGFEDLHMVYLDELSDRHIGRWNQKFEEGQGRLADNVLGLTRNQSSHFTFIRAVLVAVEQELRGEARSHARPELALVQIAAGVPLSG